MFVTIFYNYENALMTSSEHDQWAGFGALAEAETETRKGVETIRQQMRAKITKG